MGNAGNRDWGWDWELGRERRKGGIERLGGRIGDSRRMEEGISKSSQSFPPLPLFLTPHGRETVEGGISD